VIFGPFKLIIRIITLLICVVILYFAITFVQIWLTGHEHSTKHAQAILVFGTTEDNGTPSPELQARLDQALVLWHKDRAPWIAVTGGKRPGDIYTEAGASATYLEAHGVPASKILEGSGTDTWENVKTVLPKLKAHGIKTVLTVTDPFHEDRAMAISSSQDSRRIPHGAQLSDGKHSLWKYYLKETFEVGIGRIIGFETFHSWFD